MNSLQGIKRPRSESSSKKAKKKGTKKARKKGGGSSSGGGAGGVGGARDGGAGSLESTATPEGRLLAQAVSTFAPAELSRFESFRRSTFRSDAVSTFVAHRLVQNEEQRYVRRQGTRDVLGGRGVGVVPLSGLVASGLQRCPFTSGGRDGATGASQAAAAATTTTAAAAAAAQPSLRDLVAPQTSEEITVVVSTLAKSYAQRLVTASRRLATARNYPPDRPLRPHHLLEAHRHRTRAGVDPGFFMQPAGGAKSVRGGGGGGGLGAGMGFAGVHGGVVSGTTAASAAALGVPDRHGLKRNAALWAQEAYDYRVAEEEKKLEEAAAEENVANEGMKESKES